MRELTQDEQKCLEDYIKSISTEFAPVIHAHWIEEDDGWGNSYYSCSNCREPWELIEGTPEDNRMNYCPACGATMDEAGE